MNSYVKSRMEQIMGDMKNQMDNQAEELLKGSLQFIVNVVLDEMGGFENVTGNTRNSIAVALYRDGKLIGIASSFDALHHAPTRMTLIAGETYDLSSYWDGTPVDSLGKPYKAPEDSPQEENFWAQEEAIEFVQDKAPKLKGFSYIIVTAVDYAKYLEANNKANILTNFHDEMAQMGFETTDLNGD